MFYSTRSKLILGVLSVGVLVCGVALLVGGNLLYRGILREATARVRLDLNAAREIYLSRIEGIETALNLTSTGPDLPSAVDRRDSAALLERLNIVARQMDLDFMGVVGKGGGTICRIGPNSTRQEPDTRNPLADEVLQKQTGISGTVVLDSRFLFAENPQLARRAEIAQVDIRRRENGEASCMALAAAIPVRQSGNLVGVLYGGVLLNGDRKIVDRVRDTVFQNETYKGRNIGTATIFLKNVRISTNVLNQDGSRALGTVASEDVARRVLDEGKAWTDRARVLNDWHITSYEPIRDVFGRRIGMLYVGVLEAKYADERARAITIFTLISIAGMILAVAGGFLFAEKASRPVKKLIEASQQVSRGNLAPEIGPISNSEIGLLQKTFGEMLFSLRQRAEREKAESETKLLQFEKQANIGRLAGGVAHEINNPLTGIVTFTDMLLRDKSLPPSVRSDLENIAQATERVRKIVKGLLDFSRQTELVREPTDVNSLVSGAVSIVENQALVKGVRLGFERALALPKITLDRNQMQSVLLNLLLNALDATEAGGRITLTTGIGISAGRDTLKGVEIICSDTGCGIPPENLDRIFDPFFTTKDIGQGTGLGLSVCSGIVESHGGTIRVLSKIGLGSTFILWLPIEKGDIADETAGR